MTTATDNSRATTSPPTLPQGVWSIDAQRSEIGFAVKGMWGLRTVRGVFAAYDGSLEVRPGGVSGLLTIDAASLDTANERRDRHLRSSAFFDVERHPRIVFTATGVTAQGGGLTVEGELAIGSSRVRLEIPVEVKRIAGGALRVEGRTAASRTATGLAWNTLGMIRGDAMLHARLTFESADA
jgi:polyisoprenoid-binding protein YceI